LDQPYARVGKVEADQLRAISSEPIQQLLTRRYRLIRNMIGNGLPVRMLEGNQRVREDITSDNHTLAAGELKRHVTLRVARRIDEAQPRDGLIARVHQRDLILDRRVVAARARDETGALGGQSARRILAMPEFPLGLRYKEACARRDQIVEFVDRSPQMIGMAMRKNH